MIFAVLVVAILPASARSWGRDGHRVVCQMAMDRLTGDGRALIDALLVDEPAGFPDACLWADDVRRTTHGYTSAYHYVNIPPEAAGFDTRRDCADPDRCVAWAIPYYARILQDPGTPRPERTEALKFLAHFVGDLHQPLHAGRAADLGGNTIEVDFFDAKGFNGGRPNLHWVWDTEILARGGGSWQEIARDLNQQITAEQTAAWENLDVAAWTDESRAIAEEHAYRIPSNRRLDEPYYERAITEVREQIKRAGVRLAFVINGAAAGTLRFPA